MPNGRPSTASASAIAERPYLRGVVHAEQGVRDAGADRRHERPATRRRASRIAGQRRLEHGRGAEEVGLEHARAPRRGRPPRPRRARRSRRCSPGSRARRRRAPRRPPRPRRTESGSATSRRVTTHAGAAVGLLRAAATSRTPAATPPAGVGGRPGRRRGRCRAPRRSPGRSAWGSRHRRGRHPARGAREVARLAAPGAGGGPRAGGQPQREGAALARRPTRGRCRRGGPPPGRGRWRGPGRRCAPRARRRRGRSGRRRTAATRAGMPSPVSLHRDGRVPARRGRPRRRRARPAGVWRSALSSRISRICSTRAGSVSTITGSPGSGRALEGRRRRAPASGTRGATTTRGQLAEVDLAPAPAAARRRRGARAGAAPPPAARDGPVSWLIDGQELAPVALADPVALQQLEEPLERRDRRLQLVRHVGDQVAPGPLQAALVGDVAQGDDGAGVRPLAEARDRRARARGRPAGSPAAAPPRGGAGGAGGQHGVDDRRAAGRRGAPTRRPRAGRGSGWRRRWRRSRCRPAATASTPSASDPIIARSRSRSLVISATSDCRRSAMPLMLRRSACSSFGRDADLGGARRQVAAGQGRGGGAPGGGCAPPSTRARAMPARAARPSTTIIAMITRRRTIGELGRDAAEAPDAPIQPGVGEPSDLQRRGRRDGRSPALDVMTVGPAGTPRTRRSSSSGELRRGGADGRVGEAADHGRELDRHLGAGPRRSRRSPAPRPGSGPRRSPRPSRADPLQLGPQLLGLALGAVRAHARLERGQHHQQDGQAGAERPRRAARPPATPAGRGRAGASRRPPVLPAEGVAHARARCG